MSDKERLEEIYDKQRMNELSDKQRMNELSDKQRMNELSDEDENEIIELIDDDGNQLKFKILDVLKYKGEKYAFLIEAEPDGEFTENDVVIFRLNETEEILEPIEDEKLLDEVFEYFVNEPDDEEDEEISDQLN